MDKATLEIQLVDKGGGLSSRPDVVPASPGLNFGGIVGAALGDVREMFGKLSESQRQQSEILKQIAELSKQQLELYKVRPDDALGKLGADLPVKPAAGTLPPTPPPTDFMGPQLPFAEPAEMPPFYGKELPWAMPEKLMGADLHELAEAKSRLDRQQRENRIKELMAEIDPPKATLAPLPKAELVKEPKGAGGLGDLGGMLSGGLGGMGLPPGIAAAAGPVGVALAAAEGIKAKISELIQKPAVVAEKFSASAQGLARNDFSSGILQPMEELPGVFGEMAKSANRVNKAFTEASDAFLQRAKQIGNYSGELATANAMAGVSRLQTDINEAQGMGPELARMVNARAGLDSTMAEALLPIKKVVVEILGDAAETLTGFLEFAKPFIQAIADTLRFIMDIVKSIGGALVNIEAFIADWTGLPRVLQNFLTQPPKRAAGPTIDPNTLASNDRMADILLDLVKHMKAPPAVGVPRIF